MFTGWDLYRGRTQGPEVRGELDDLDRPQPDDIPARTAFLFGCDSVDELPEPLRAENPEPMIEPAAGRAVEEMGSAIPLDHRRLLAHHPQR